MRAIAFGAIALALVSASTSAETWHSYHNERFGTTADVPADWRAGAPPDNGDGLEFTSLDGTATLVVSGGFNVWETIDEAMEIYDAPDEGETVTYRHRTDRSIVLSGTAGDRIFYRKSILSCHDQVWNSISIEYPATDKERYEPLVTHVANSLRPGMSEQVAECP